MLPSGGIFYTLQIIHFSTLYSGNNVDYKPYCNRIGDAYLTKKIKALPDIMLR